MATGRLLTAISENYAQYQTEADPSLKDAIKKRGSGGAAANIGQQDRQYLCMFNAELPLIHELPYRVLVQYPTLLSKLSPAQITWDHLHYWAWTAEVTKNPFREDDLRGFERDIHDQFLKVIDFAVAQPAIPPVMRQIWEENKKLRDQLGPHNHQVLLRSAQAATQMCYPLLEGVLRRLCPQVKIDGKIKSGERIVGTDGEVKNRRPNFGELLHHYALNVTDDEMAFYFQALESDMSQYSEGQRRI